MAAVSDQQRVAPLSVHDELQARFPGACHSQTCIDGMPTVWVERAQLLPLMRYLKHEAPNPYVLLFDLSVIDERLRVAREGQPASDFTVFYHLISLARNQDLRVKVALSEFACSLPSIAQV